ncbi:ribonuclease H1-like [Diachasmimorpha longicaudata]|uniref:ribonuclease H1-like n=1 Tax=Diachasmimorpha longicaudata TaxID=58733 RepID=UPI0030B8C0C8
MTISISGYRNMPSREIQNQRKIWTTAYIDGSCSYNGTINAIAGVRVWFGDRHPLNTYQTMKEERATNITAEAAAAVKACGICIRHDIKRVNLITDSKYLINCMTKHLPKWKQNGWLNAKSKPVANQKLLKELDILTQQLEVQFEYTPGHKGTYGNERVDELAKTGSKIYTPT